MCAHARTKSASSLLRGTMIVTVYAMFSVKRNMNVEIMEIQVWINPARCADWRRGRVVDSLVDSGPRGPGSNPQLERLSLWP